MPVGRLSLCLAVLLLLRRETFEQVVMDPQWRFLSSDDSGVDLGQQAS